MHWFKHFLGRCSCHLLLVSVCVRMMPRWYECRTGKDQCDPPVGTMRNCVCMQGKGTSISSHHIEHLAARYQLDRFRLWSVYSPFARCRLVMRRVIKHALPPQRTCKSTLVNNHFGFASPNAAQDANGLINSAKSPITRSLAYCIIPRAHISLARMYFVNGPLG